MTLIAVKFLVLCRFGATSSPLSSLIRIIEPPTLPLSFSLLIFHSPKFRYTISKLNKVEVLGNMSDKDSAMKIMNDGTFHEL